MTRDRNILNVFGFCLAVLQPCAHAASHLTSISLSICLDKQLQMEDSLALLFYILPALVTVLTFPSIWGFAKSIRRAKVVDHSGLYEDRDGVATEESMKKFSARKLIIIVSVAVVIGLAASFAFAISVTVPPVPAFDDLTRLWLLFWSWVCWIPPPLRQTLYSNW